MKDKIRVAVIGCGGRGRCMAENVVLFKDVELVAICDVLEYKMEMMISALKRAGVDDDKMPRMYSDYKTLFEKEKLDCVQIHTSWATHVDIAVCAMQHGVMPGLDCGGAYSIDDCWRLVRTSEETGVSCMYLENCCYDRAEMAILRMIKEGKFGEVVHLQGGYEHDLRWEISHGTETDHYRFDNYRYRCADFYPQHALGPLMKFVNVNRGNRLLSLTSTASKAVGLHEYIEKQHGTDYFSSKIKFAEGDVVTTVIKCAGGETILLTHDTSLPRPYSRGGRVQGTKAIWMEDKNAIAFDGDEEWRPFGEYLNNPEYEHPIWTEIRTDPAKLDAGHGGMDYLVLDAFYDCIRTNTKPPIDVYDAAVLMAVTAASEESIAKGSAPVEIPDFTNGKWMKREPAPAVKYALDGYYPERY